MSNRNSYRSAGRNSNRNDRDDRDQRQGDHQPYTTDLPVLEVSDVKVRQIRNPQGRTLGFASCVVGGHIALRDLRIVDGRNGPFVAAPERSYEGEDGTQYTAIYLPITKEQNEAIQDAVLAVWDDEVSGGSRSDRGDRRDDRDAPRGGSRGGSQGGSRQGGSRQGGSRQGGRSSAPRGRQGGNDNDDDDGLGL